MTAAHKPSTSRYLGRTPFVRRHLRNAFVSVHLPSELSSPTSHLKSVLTVSLRDLQVYPERARRIKVYPRCRSHGLEPSCLPSISSPSSNMQHHQHQSIHLPAADCLPSIPQLLMSI